MINIIKKSIPIISTIILLQIVICNAQGLSSDKKATLETRKLNFNLKKLASKGVMLGHEDDLTVSFHGQNSRDTSDLKNLMGDYPAVFGWDIGNVELGKMTNYWGVSLSEMTEGIKKVYTMGGINTISWLVHDPANPRENSHSKSDTTVKSIFSNPKTLYQYRFWLDKLAFYLGNLKGPKGESIPVILRLFHEHTGHWYWWAANRCTPEEFKKLYRFTVFYLRDTKHIHNVLYAYCSDHFNTQTEYLERYPGDDVIDIIGVDMYDHPKYNFVTEGQNMVSLIKTIGTAKNKPYAIMETGLIDKSEDNWWTNSLSPVVKNSGLSYVLTWANAPKVIFSPYVGKINTDDFKIFAANGLLFLKDIKSHSVYK